MLSRPGALCLPTPTAGFLTFGHSRICRATVLCDTEKPKGEQKLQIDVVNNYLLPECPRQNPRREDSFPPEILAS